MKYRCFPFLFGLLLLSFVLHAEQNIIPSYKQLDPIQVTQSPNVRWRLFPTQNMYTFLQLDTSTGGIMLREKRPRPFPAWNKHEIDGPSGPRQNQVHLASFMVHINR